MGYIAHMPRAVNFCINYEFKITLVLLTFRKLLVLRTTRRPKDGELFVICVVYIQYFMLLHYTLSVKPPSYA